MAPKCHMLNFYYLQDHKKHLAKPLVGENCYTGEELPTFQDQYLANYKNNKYKTTLRIGCKC